MNTLTTSVNELILFIKEFKFQDALEKFYSEDVITVENEGQPTAGLDAYKEAAKRYIDNVSDYKAELLNVIISDNISACEWRYTFSHKEWGKWDKIQVSVQRWKDGKIIHERHHYSA